MYSTWYAITVIKGRLPDFMHNLMEFSDDESALVYMNFISE